MPTLVALGDTHFSTAPLVPAAHPLVFAPQFAVSPMSPVAIAASHLLAPAFRLAFSEMTSGRTHAPADFEQYTEVQQKLLA